ncbi:MAG TPA: hypothetical protein DDZ80_05615 [Cyanobacteria bacterium UBA8803]|nr:hypothetical protein [Cyanobacteria bacterium UBA9273]HBL58015.1 hypothetical protein [Cyanobacteria bacterium UBA8803]
MQSVEKLQSALDALNTKRSQIAGVGWYLQHCWLVQVKPGGNARTNRKYWQVRSRQPMFDGKKLKHLKPDEVEDYRAAIDRGQQLKQIDRQIEQLQQQLEQLIGKTDSSGSLSKPHQTPPQNPILSTESLQKSLAGQPQSTVRFNDLAEQERLVKEVLAKSQELRDAIKKSLAVSNCLRVRVTNVRNRHPGLQ